jgi:hypothetical protein
VTTGLSPAEMGVEIRLGRVGRENAASKALRLLTSGRVAVRHWSPTRGEAFVRGDSGVIRHVTYSDGVWLCGCECRGACSHVRAVQQVTEVSR